MAQFIIPTIFRAIDQMSSPMMRMRAGLVSMTAATTKMRGEMAATNATMMEMGTSGLMIGAAIILPLALATHAAVKFEKEMSNISTLVDTSKESMKDMGDQVLSMSKHLPVAIADLTEALYQVRSAGIESSKAMDVLDKSARLGVAGLGTTVEAANMVTSAMNVFKRESLDANTAADVLFKTVAGGKTKVALLAEGFGKSALAASDVGISFRELMAMTAAMTNTGVQTAEAQTGITQALISLNKRTSEMIDIQQKLTGHLGITGMEFIKWAGSGVQAMEKIDKYATANRLDLFKVYGRKEGALADIALTRLQNDTYNKLYATMKGGNSIDEAFAKQLGTTAAQSQLAKNQLEILGIRIGELLLPAIKSIVQAITPVIEGLSNFANRHKTLAGFIVKSVAAFGIFALVVGAGALVISTVTRAMWLWNAAVGVFNLIIGTSAGLLGLFTTRLLTSRLAFYGYTVGVYAAQAATAVFGTTLTGVLATLSLVVAGLALIYRYRTQIQNWANDSSAGMAYNNMIGDTETVRQSVERKYINDPTGAKKFLEENPKYNTSDVQDAIGKIDRGEKLNDDNDLYIAQHKFEKGTDTVNNNNPVNIYIQTDKSGNTTVNTKGAPGAIPINIKQTGY